MHWLWTPTQRNYCLRMRIHETTPAAERLKKIRLIVSDLDGTLLNESKQLPPDFASLISRLSAKGIVFATASGRNWDSQKDFFSTCKEHMAFVCDNGAFLIHQQKPLFISALSPELWRGVVAACTQYGPDCGAVVCGVKGAYTLRATQLWPVISQFYSKPQFVDSFDQVNDTVFKVSVCCLRGTPGPLYTAFNSRFSDHANLVCTHPLFMDVMNRGINKGAGVRLLQRHLGITAEETMAFGDFDNDIEMLQSAGIAYVMENAPPSMRQYAEFLAPSNENGGVVTIIQSTLFS